MKIAITGSRIFTDFTRLCQVLDNLAPSEIIVGGAKGADTLAEQYADKNNIPKTIFLPKFKTDKNIIYHPRWFHIRNRSLVDYADMVVAFWDGNAGGTKNTIDYANRVNKRTLVIRFQYPMH